jgi:hypothetical protein
MTTALANQQITIGNFLSGEGGLGPALQASGAADQIREQLTGFTEPTRSEAVAEVEKISADVLNLDVGDVLVGALAGYAALREAGRRTAADTEASELVELVSHEISLDNQPSIDLLVDGVQVATVHLTLSLLIDVQAMTATVRAGRLTGLRVGRCDVTASISVDGITVASKQGQLQLPVSLPVGAGIPLTAPARPG